MINRKDDKILVQGSVTIDNVATITRQGIALFDGRDLIVDLVKVDEVDSSIVSMMLEWSREANRRCHQIHFVNSSENLRSLVNLYGITELIPLVQNDKAAN